MSTDEKPEQGEVKGIVRREARSGSVSYSDPVILYESSKSRIVLVPFFIQRTNGTELAIKIETHKKGPPPIVWAIVEQKSISMKETATRKLLQALREHLAVADLGKDGSYFVVRVEDGAADLGDHTPDEIAGALTRVLGRPDVARHLAGVELSDELVQALRGAIRIKEMRSAVESLRHSLEVGETQEAIYQRWCEDHSWAFGSAYVMRDEVRDISTGDSLDLLLPQVISGYRDIVELKRPSMPVLLEDTAHRNFYFSADVSKAIGQCHRYLDVLHEEASHGLRDHPEVVAYHPRATIVIGRSEDWDIDKLKALHGLNQRLSSITVMTYDQLLAQGQRLVEMLSVEEDDSDDEALEDIEIGDGDGIPF